MIKKVGKGVYADVEKKYAICKTFNGEWSVFRITGDSKNPMEFKCGYKRLDDAKDYIDRI